MRLDELFSVALVILLGILGGKLSHRLRIPRVTGYMLTGLFFGPSVLGIITPHSLQQIALLNDIALGLILFAIGGEIEWRHLRSMGKSVLMIALAESAGAFLLVTVATYLITGDIGLAVLLGSIAIATAPGVTLLVIREYQARGPLTDTLLAVVAINNVLCLLTFRVIFAGYSLASGDAVGGVVLMLFKELVLSVLIGAVIAAMIAFWEHHIDDLSELLLVIVAGLLLGIGIARTIGISPLMVCLIIGAVTNNLSVMHRLVYAELRQTEMPFYIAFFVLSGASLHLNSLAHLGLLGMVYLVSRPVGKYLGAIFTGRKFALKDAISNNLGLALLPQAGVAIGLMMTVSRTQPEMGSTIATVILSSVIVYEGIGPFLTRLAIARAGEVHLQE